MAPDGFASFCWVEEGSLTSNTGIGDDPPDLAAASDEARARVTCEAEVIWADSVPAGVKILAVTVELFEIWLMDFSCTELLLT